MSLVCLYVHKLVVLRLCTEFLQVENLLERQLEATEQYNCSTDSTKQPALPLPVGAGPTGVLHTASVLLLYPQPNSMTIVCGRAWPHMVVLGSRMFVVSRPLLSAVDVQ